MKLTNLTLLVALFLILVITAHSADPVDPQVKEKKSTVDETSKTTNPETKLNEKPGSNLETKKTDPLEKAKVSSNDIGKGNVDKATSQELGGDESGKVKTGSNDKGLADKKSKADEEKNALKEESSSSARKGSFQGELCDSAFKCTIDDGKNHGMVACLSVPGDESTEVSLLIQNKGKGLLDVDIKAPDLVRLDKSKVQIQENENEKVTVSIGSGKTEKHITLKTSKGSCSLDFINFLTHNPTKKSNYMPQLTYTSLFRRTPFIGLVSLALLLVTVSVLVCVTYQRRRLVNNGIKYQKLDTELPVSARPNIDFDQKDGWDDTWSDDWGDVEAPSTPSMPLTPSISSAGVSSRRINKDAWKD
uniref:uncharacterized protein LOC122578687 n=1 Tax=Erigeron canadensis TaxID=72917 RepID=UPI001CB89719|nr:uncharacterized protein LOC122578687 [Erigeron canadensis]